MLWAQRACAYDETLDSESPQDSGFKGEALEAEFQAEGHRLAVWLGTELGPDFVVVVQF